MSVATGPCPAISDRLTEQLGGFDCSGSPFVEFRNPADLIGWTLPVLELTMALGAALTVWYAIRRWRRAGDPVPLVLILAGLVYLAVIEPVLYFPNKAGLGADNVLFAHNVFTVDFLYDRLPLYIVALYIALPVLAFEMVRSMGVFARRGALVGGICAGVVHGCLYEIFDQLGPQLRWWIWNTGNAAVHPMLDSVPLPSAVLSSTVSPSVLIFLVYRLVGQKITRGEPISRAGYLWRTLVAGALTPAAQGLASFPLAIAGAGDQPNLTGQAIVLWIELGLMTVVAVVAMTRTRREIRSGPVAAGRPPAGAVVLIFGPAYLLVMAALWFSALPDFFAATGGLTSDATPIGNLPFMMVCFAGAVVSVAVSVSAGRTDRSGMPPAYAGVGAGREQA